jgi:hypothetical protein
VDGGRTRWRMEGLMDGCNILKLVTLKYSG